MVFDLDPGPDTSIVECCRVALLLRDMFKRLKLESVAKTSGSKGLQLYIPLNDAGRHLRRHPRLCQDGGRDVGA